MEGVVETAVFALIGIGVLVTIVGLILAAFHRPSTAKRTRFGGLIMVGPFPIVIGSDAKMARSLLYVAVAIIVAFIALTVLLNLMIFAA
ncbi:MAG: DUF131 domain-containing protein [Candidatus Bathyarchaeia archaeon]